MKILTPIAEASISTINCLLLRSVTGKECFSETITSEFTIYADALHRMVIQNQEGLEEVRDIIKREMASGYIEDVDYFSTQLFDFYSDHPEIETGYEEWETLADFYIEIARDVVKERDDYEQ